MWGYFIWNFKGRNGALRYAKCDLTTNIAKPQSEFTKKTEQSRNFWRAKFVATKIFEQQTDFCFLHPPLFFLHISKRLFFFLHTSKTNLFCFCLKPKTDYWRKNPLFLLRIIKQGTKCFVTFDGNLRVNPKVCTLLSYDVHQKLWYVQVHEEAPKIDYFCYVNYHVLRPVIDNMKVLFFLVPSRVVLSKFFSSRSENVLELVVHIYTLLHPEWVNFLL